KKSLIKNHIFKLFNWRYGFLNIINLYLLIWPNYTRFYDPHIPYAYKKSQYGQVMSKYSGEQYKTGHHRFREISDITHWLVRYERLVTGQFSPSTVSVGKLLYLGSPIPEKKKLITVGDKDMSQIEFETEIVKLQKYFDKKYSKSNFEK